jgi:putative ABC transport system permease protein
MAQTASFREATAVAADSLRSSKLRSFLTLFGIILATTTLIAVMSVIHGMDVYIANSVSDMGADGFRVVRIAFLGNFDPKKFLELQKKNPQLSPEEYNYLKSSATLLSEFGMNSDRGANISLGTHTMKSVDLTGGTPNWAALANTQLATGRYFSDIENNLTCLATAIPSARRSRWKAGHLR